MSLGPETTHKEKIGAHLSHGCPRAPPAPSTRTRELITSTPVALCISTTCTRRRLWGIPEAVAALLNFFFNFFFKPRCSHLWWSDQPPGLENIFYVPVLQLKHLKDSLFLGSQSPVLFAPLCSHLAKLYSFCFLSFFFPESILPVGDENKPRGVCSSASLTVL